MATRRARARGVRVLCVSQGQLLLVLHHDPATDRRYWVLPGGGREPGETLAAAAVREVYEETGVVVRLIRRLRVPARAEDLAGAQFLAEPVAHVAAAPTVDLSSEVYLRAAARHPISAVEPLGPLNEEFWGHLRPRLRRLLREQSETPRASADVAAHTNA
jgi:8-oxo-dGTP pyrophosphatase MutT (NUDIX family)